MKITWMTQGSFLFESNGTRILVDPYMSSCLAAKGFRRKDYFPLPFRQLNIDLLICTHDHLDHLDPETVKKVARLYPKCKFAGPISCCAHFMELGIKDSQRRMLKVGERFTFGDFKITAVPAFHSEPDAVGLVLKVKGKKIYLSADTLYDDSLVNKNTKNCEVILICINGKLGNMPYEDALKVVKAAKPKIALPMHYGLFAENTADPKPFIDECNAVGIKSFEMKVGEEICL